MQETDITKTPFLIGEYVTKNEGKIRAIGVPVKIETIGATEKEKDLIVKIERVSGYDALMNEKWEPIKGINFIGYQGRDWRTLLSMISDIIKKG